MAIYLKMTKDVEKKTGVQVSADNAMHHKGIKDELTKKKEEIKMTRMTGDKVTSANLVGHKGIKDELEKKKEVISKSRMAGTKLTQE